MKATAGADRKGDALVTIETGAEPLSIEISSPVDALFGKQIHAAAKETAMQLGLSTGKLSIRDSQALGFVIIARIKAAYGRLGKEGRR